MKSLALGEYMGRRLAPFDQGPYRMSAQQTEAVAFCAHYCGRAATVAGGV
jgi:hypothetical protein